MKLTHSALVLMTVLLGITAYLAWEGQQAVKGQREELEFQRKRIAAMEAATPKQQPSRFAPLSTEPVIPPSTQVPTMAGHGLMPGTPGSAAPAQLTPMQKQVLGMPAVAKVIVAENTQGFVVIDAGKNKQLTKGQKFDVRRNDGVIGRVSIGETIDQAEAVADIDASVVLPGVSIEPGDELILPVSK